MSCICPSFYLLINVFNFINFFYIALSHIKIRTGEKNTRTRNKLCTPTKTEKISKYGRTHPLKDCMNPGTRCKPYLTLYYLGTLPVLKRSRTITYFITLSRTIPYLSTLPNHTLSYFYCRILFYLNTLSRAIPYLNTLLNYTLS